MNNLIISVFLSFSIIACMSKKALPCQRAETKLLEHGGDTLVFKWYLGMLSKQFDTERNRIIEQPSAVATLQNYYSFNVCVADKYVLPTNIVIDTQETIVTELRLSFKIPHTIKTIKEADSVYKTFLELLTSKFGNYTAADFDESYTWIINNKTLQLKTTGFSIIIVYSMK